MSEEDDWDEAGSRPPHDEGEDEDDDGSDLTLVFLSTGQVVLEENGSVTWTSDDDDEFQEDFTNEFLDADTDGAKILNWLVEHDWIDKEEKGEVEIETDDGTEDESENESTF